MPLYVGDYLKATAHLTAAEHGAYMLLIMHYWSNGSLPSDDRRLSMIARMSADEWSESRAAVAAFFNLDWTHDRIDEEIEKAAISYDRRAAAGRKGGLAKAGPEQCLSNATAGLKQSHSDSSLRSEGVSESREREAEKAGQQDAKADEFYAAYPKKLNPDDAKKAFCKRVKSGVDPDVIISATHRFADAHRRAGTEKQFIPAPAVWLNKGGYASEDLPEPRAGPQPIASNVVNPFPSRANLNVQPSRSASHALDRMRLQIPRDDDEGGNQKLLAGTRT